ncbi:hypothetical protein DTO164E3_5505 [Paecilomyces variotii]|nr:hypothetical protein DTO164E3_5505 [Paecilomyces variotii]KAJ9256776.1 hypothetical protein DTO207G8_2379 [Paecilomyces variotii]KAJ9314888.1 hypothetical protein DTO271D3_4888 [Paecilomyces variotii]KAJ9379413.1 hypothetical protein DTO063F5_7183 [Paecilomyces variotii]
MGVTTIPEIKYTPLEEIPQRVAKLRDSFNENKTRPVEYRLVQLRKLYWAIKEREDLIQEALSYDLGKPAFEAYSGEIGWLENDIIFVTRHLEQWVKDEKPSYIDFSFKFVNPRIRKDPLGIVLVIGSFNFPFQLTLGPVIGAIAGGNTVVIKPSQNSSRSAVVMQQIIEASLDPSSYTIVQGGIPETQALLEERWDKIFFTGSAPVGRIVAKAAAEHLTPVVLELGGMNPAIVTKNADPRLVARRMLWGKTLNAGQVCTSQNYILVERGILPAVIEEFKKAYKEFYPQGAKASPDFARIINDGAFRRLKSMIDSSQGKIIVGGTLDEKTRFIEPTIVQVESTEDALLTQESFGPIISLLPVDSLDEAIEIANRVQATPLGIYAFGTSEEAEKVLRSTRSGGAAVNDAAFHIPTLEFGGVGESGHGAYRGKASFDCFVHRRPVTTTPSWLESVITIRYPPYAGKLAKFRVASQLTPDFDREGRKIRFRLLRAILTLGGGTVKAGAGRAAVLAIHTEEKSPEDPEPKE